MVNEWLTRWREGRIGFHRDAPHPALCHHWPLLGVSPGVKVLVPLCGKSHDMRWLGHRDHPVLGIELAPQAVEQFLAEGSGPVSRYHQAGFEIARQANVELWCGDFFHFHIEQAAEIGAFYDRAALIALPPATRQRYAFHLAQLVPPGARGLFVSLNRAAGEERSGPPFHVPEEEVRELFEPNFRITLLERGAPEPGSGFREHVWALVRRGPVESPLNAPAGGPAPGHGRHGSDRRRAGR